MTKTNLPGICVLFLLLINCPNYSFAQKSFLPGYLILHEGDSITGFIDYKNWKSNPDVISFKKELNASETEYHALSVKKFAVKDEVYVGAIFEKEVSSDVLKDMDNRPEPKLVKDTAFLQTMIDGPKSLYTFSQRSIADQFYIKQGEKYELLVFKKYVLRQRDRSNIATNIQFKNQLSAYLSDCKTITKKLATVEYNKKDLENLFSDYYNCNNSEIGFQKKAEKLRFEPGILGGFSLTAIRFKSDVSDFLVNADYTKSINPALGVFLDIVLPRANNSWSFNNELLYTRYNIDGKYQVYENPEKFSNTFTTFGYSYLKLNNMFRYRKSTTNVSSVFANIGWSLGRVIGEKNYKRIETTFYTSESTTESKALDSKNVEGSLLFGMGYTLNKLSAEARYEIGNGASADLYIQQRTNRLYLLISYRLKK